MRGEVDKLKILLALIFIFQGMSIAVLSNPLLKVHPWLRLFGVLLMALGILYIYFKYKIAKTPLAKVEQEERITKVYESTRDDRIKAHILKRKVGPKSVKSKSKPELEAEPQPEDTSILIRFMSRLVKGTEGISPYILPIIGAIIIDAVIIYNILEEHSLDLHGFDTITITFGISLILYNYIPEQYIFARDFFVFFLGLLFFILVFPPIFYNLLFGAGEGSHGNAIVTKYFLGDPLAGLLNLFGIKSSCSIVFLPEGEVATVYFVLANGGQQASVGIGEACSGIYTVSIFLSAFITFILLEYKRFDRKVGLLIGLGILTAYIANIFRMTIIVLVGHYYDSNPTDLANLGWAHANAGWLIFLAWIIPFWLLMYRFLMKKDLSKSEDEDLAEDS